MKKKHVRVTMNRGNYYTSKTKRVNDKKGGWRRRVRVFSPSTDTQVSCCHSVSALYIACFSYGPSRDTTDTKGTVVAERNAC